MKKLIPIILAIVLMASAACAEIDVSLLAR